MHYIYTLPSTLWIINTTYRLGCLIENHWNWSWKVLLMDIQVHLGRYWTVELDEVFRLLSVRNITTIFCLWKWEIKVEIVGRWSSSSVWRMNWIFCNFSCCLLLNVIFCDFDIYNNNTPFEKTHEHYLKIKPKINFLYLMLRASVVLSRLSFLSVVSVVQALS